MDEALLHPVLYLDRVVAVVARVGEGVADALEVDSAVAEVGERSEVVDDIVEVERAGRERFPVLRERGRRRDVLQVNVLDIVGEPFDSVRDVALRVVFAVRIVVGRIPEETNIVGRVREPVRISSGDSTCVAP